MEEHSQKQEIHHEQHSSQKIEERKDKIKSWLKDPYNLTLVGILVFAFAIRLYYFWMTKNQPLWWDEADYMAYAKNLAGFQTSWIVTPQHNSLFPFIAALFFKIGFSDTIIKFFLEIVPSFFVVLLSYLICKNLYEDKRIALISAFIVSVFWEFLFDSMRFHFESLALMTGLLSVYVFFKGYERKEKIFGKIDPKWTMLLTVILVIITYSIRRGFFMFWLFFLLYLIFTKKFSSLIRDKYNWISLIIALAALFFVEKFIFVSPITEVVQTYYSGGTPLNLIPLQVFKSYFENIFNPSFSVLLYLFWIGLFVIVINVALSIGY